MAAAAHDGVAKIPATDRLTWESPAHAIWCSYYPPQNSMKSTTTVSFVTPGEALHKYDGQAAGGNEASKADEDADGEITHIGQSGSYRPNNKSMCARN